MPDDNPRTPEETNTLNSIEQEQPTQAISSPSQNLETTPMPTPKKKMSKRTLIIIIAAAVLLLGAGVALAYKFWYQNPDKVVADAFSNALKAKSYSYDGTFKLTTNDVTADITFNGAATKEWGAVDVKLTTEASDQNITLKSKAFVDAKGDLYLQLNNLDELASSLFGSMGMGMLPPSFDSVINTVNGQWIRIDADDLTQYTNSGDQEATACTDALKQLQPDTNAQDELAKVYKEHSFVNVDESLEDATINGIDSLGYRLTIDEDTLNEFSRQAGDLAAVKALEVCGSDDKSAAAEEDTASDSIINVYISRWSHELTQVKIATVEGEESDGELIINTDFNNEVKAEAPQNAMTLEELQAEIEAAMMAYQQELMEQIQTSESEALERSQNVSEQAELAA